jgi:hypothetical protein
MQCCSARRRCASGKATAAARHCSEVCLGSRVTVAVHCVAMLFFPGQAQQSFCSAERDADTACTTVIYTHVSVCSTLSMRVASSRDTSAAAAAGAAASSAACAATAAESLDSSPCFCCRHHGRRRCRHHGRRRCRHRHQCHRRQRLPVAAAACAWRHPWANAPAD